MRKVHYLLVLVSALFFVVFSGVTSAESIQSVLSANYNKAMDLAEKGEFREALRLIRENQALDPDYFNHYRHEAHVFEWWLWSVYNDGGEAEIIAQLLRGAFSAYDMAIEVALENHASSGYVARIYFDKGKTAYSYGDLLVAKRSFEEAVRISPDSVPYNYNLGVVLLVQGTDESLPHSGHEQMIQAFVRAVENNSDHAYPILEAYYYVGWELHARGEISEAKKHLQIFLHQVDRFYPDLTPALQETVEVVERFLAEL